MNKEVLMEVVNWLESDDMKHKGAVGFDMTKYIQHTSCGSVCCIAGAVIEFSGEDESPEPWGQAERLADLREEDSYELFFPKSMETETAGHAARVLRHLIDTGEVDWSIA